MFRTLPWTPAYEDVIQLALRKAVLNSCLITIVMDGVRQLMVSVRQWYSQGPLRETDRISDFLQPPTGKGNWITSSYAGATGLRELSGEHTLIYATRY
jgi:hypothetical protein